jgi:hypothetical protein
MENILEPGMPQMTVRCKRIACWISEVTDTQSKYVRIIALPQQQWLHKDASLLHYTCIASPVYQCILRLFIFVSVIEEVRPLTIF